MKVLIAEDDYRVADIHHQFLERVGGLQVLASAATAGETLRLAGELKPDLLLLDVYLPDSLGISIIGPLREQCPDLQIILITAATDREILTKALNHGVVDYLIKPIELERLSEAVSRAVQTRHVLKGSEDVNQALIDRLFQSETSSPREALPKGIDQLTLEKVKELLGQQEEGITAEALGKLFGASRTTSRRYLEYLISIKEAEAELVYGIVGRPERKYKRK
ncbi:response regulator [Rossellomorea marisflavi]|uniref:response regulator n=1 Tax=Rossellomorea marisflavi TaxID=189381 RepID=UPI0025B0D518|nr:response regulator [Rossellomorea marisflavi]WJV19080.1 response regulator [Rossellomorea marisflavi]